MAGKFRHRGHPVPNVHTLTNFTVGRRRICCEGLASGCTTAETTAEPKQRPPKLQSDEHMHIQTQQNVISKCTISMSNVQLPEQKIHGGQSRMPREPPFEGAG